MQVYFLVEGKLLSHVHDAVGYDRGRLGRGEIATLGVDARVKVEDREGVRSPFPLFPLTCLNFSNFTI